MFSYLGLDLLAVLCGTVCGSRFFDFKVWAFPTITPHIPSAKNNTFLSLSLVYFFSSLLEIVCAYVGIFWNR